ncbi:MAG: isocitrate/isopropylmalate family dehydrogenase [Planctomycetota bacterium]
MRIALAAGDGIGPEIMAATLELFAAAGVSSLVEFVPVEMGQEIFARGNTRGMTDEAIRVVEDLGVLFKGPMATPTGGGGKSINVTARKMWSAYANYRHFRTLPGVVTPYSKAGINLDFSIVRENIEDTYGGIEHRLTNDVMVAKRIITAPGCDEVLRFAFETAKRLGIDTVHCSHKANIMKMTDGLFLERFRKMAAEYPGIAAPDVIVDALCMNLVMKPQQYKMVVLTNLQGDIVSDLAAGLVGGLGFAPSANIGRNIAIFEAVHGTAPDIAGKGIANPTALLLSGLMMLRHIGLEKQAATIENALLVALEDGAHTGDFGDRTQPTLNTDAFIKQIIARLGKEPHTVKPAPAGKTDRITCVPPPKPESAMMMRTITGVKKEIAGIDVYVEAVHPAADTAVQMERICAASPFNITLISCRGMQVWPRGSAFTECVDYWRVRFELRDSRSATQSDAIALLGHITESNLVSEYELLRTFDGARGWTLAQGQ